MAPARNSSRRNHVDQIPSSRTGDSAGLATDLFLEPMMGTPLQMYIEKDVADRDVLVDIITVSRVDIRGPWSKQLFRAHDLMAVSWEQIYSMLLTLVS